MMKYLPARFAIGLLIVVWCFFVGQKITAQEAITWSTPVQLSEASTFNWFPDLVVDHEGRPHVIWDGGLAPGEKLNQPKTIVSLIMYTRLDGQAWTQPLDVVAAFHKSFTLENMPQASLNLAQDGKLLLWYAGKLHRAPAETAHQSAATWSEPIEISREILYGGGVVMDQEGILHALYDGPAVLEEPIGRGITKIEHLSDVFYRRSLDSGRTWSAPLNLSQTQIGESGVRLEIDEQGILYATWVEGWDRHVNFGLPRKGVLTISEDGGHTWSDKSTFSFPEQTNAQLAVTSNNQGGVLAVWRPTSHKVIMYSWSVDGGESWSIPKAVPYVFARIWDDTELDSYDLAVDSAGTIHLVVSARLQANRVFSQLYHLSWDGKTWSEPNLIFDGPGWPESPRITIAQGNQLHVVWFSRDQLEMAYHTLYQIWYSKATINTAGQIVAPSATPTLQPTLTPQPTPDLTPTVSKSAVTEAELEAIRGIHASIFAGDNNLPMLLAKSLAPLLIGVLSFGTGRYLLKRLRRK